MDKSVFNILPTYVGSLRDKSKILYITQSGTSGYANAAKGYIYDLIQKKFSVKIQTVDLDDSRNVEKTEFDEYITSHNQSVGHFYDTVIVHTTPNIWESLLSKEKIGTNRYVIGRTVWEFDQLPVELVNCINQSRVNIVSVPTQWNKDTFEKSGVIKPIVVEPHIHVTFPYKNKDLRQIISSFGEVFFDGDINSIDFKQSYKFYTIGQFITRKGIEETIESFCKTFIRTDNVILIVKTFGKNYSNEQIEICRNKIQTIIKNHRSDAGHAPIVYLKDQLSYDVIQSLHDQCDCYIQLTRTEGFGLGIFEAYNRGKKVIVTNYGGHTEFIPKTYHGLVDYELQNVTDPIFYNIHLNNTYKWAKPSITHAQTLMKLQYVHSRKHDVEISLVSGFYPRENFNVDPSKNGNVSSWTKESCHISVLDPYNQYTYSITLFNHYGENKYVCVKNEEIDIKFDISHGQNNITFTTTLPEVKLTWHKSFCPRELTNTDDHRILGAIIENIFVNGRNVNIINHVFKQNMKSNFSGLVRFEPKEIEGKKVGIVGYIPKPDISNANNTFYKHIHSSKSYAGVILFSDSGWDNTIRVEDPLSVVKKNKDSIGLWTFYKSLIIAKKYELDYFLMVESDCRFLKENWDYDLFKTAIDNDIYCYGSLNVSKYTTDNDELKWLSDVEVCNHDRIDENTSYKTFPCISQGDVSGKSPHYIWTNGACSVYKTQAFYDLLNGDLNVILDKWFTWDLDTGKVIVDTLGMAEAKNKVVHCGTIASNVDSIVTPKFVYNNKHNFAAIHPVKNKWCPPKDGVYKFYHSGDLGDIIYSLPAIKTIGGGHLIIGNQSNSTSGFCTREPMTLKRYEFILPLLKKVGYLHSVSYSDETENQCDYNFNEFRYYWNDSTYRSSQKIDRLMDMNLDFVGLRGMFDDTQSWIEVEKTVTKKYVVSRSKRYRDDTFPWKDIYNIIKNDCIFVGLDDEHLDFCENFGPIEHVKVKDALQLAEIINGSECFIGNQSFPMSLAVAMNKSIIQEYSSHAKDCIFDSRNNFKTKENYRELIVEEK